MIHYVRTGSGCLICPGGVCAWFPQTTISCIDFKASFKRLVYKDIWHLQFGVIPPAIITESLSNFFAFLIHWLCQVPSLIILNQHGLRSLQAGVSSPSRIFVQTKEIESVFSSEPRARFELQSGRQPLTPPSFFWPLCGLYSLFPSYQPGSRGKDHHTYFFLVVRLKRDSQTLSPASGQPRGWGCPGKAELLRCKSWESDSVNRVWSLTLLCTTSRCPALRDPG